MNGKAEILRSREGHSPTPDPFGSPTADPCTTLTRGEFASFLVDDDPRLLAFRELVILQGALTTKPDRGLFGLDWRMAAEAMKRIRRLETDATTNFEPWLVLVERSIDIVLAGKDKERLQSDHLTRRATHQPVRLLLLFMMSGLVDAVSRLSEASARVHALVNVPEAILQCLACGFCEIDFSSSPGGFPEADYNKYFGGRDAFVLPTAGKKLMLAGLLVLVPALLGVRKVVGAKSLIDPDRIRPLQQRLVDAVRNPASHTIADFVQKDAAMLEGLCREWIEEWCAIEGLASQRALPLRALAPTSEQLMALVTG